MDGAVHSLRAHAQLSPSSSHRWMHCPGSVAAEDGVPRRSSRLAAEGTAAHELAQCAAETGCDPAALIGREIRVEEWSFPVDAAMADHVRGYLDAMRFETEPGATVWWERRLPLPHLPGDQFGTVDFAAYLPGREKLVVGDLKYGQYLLVEATGNSQLVNYALGALFEVPGPVRQVDLLIYQPRAWHPLGPLRRWTLTPADLAEWATDLGRAARTALAPDAPREAGDWCRWCAGQPTCATAAMHALVVAGAVFSPVPETTPDTLDWEQVVALLPKLDAIRYWASAVKDYAYEQMRAGHEAAGWKLVAKAPCREWSDEQGVEAVLQSAGVDVDRYAPRKLVSPAKAEGLLPKPQRALIAPYVTRRITGLALVPASDPRPAVERGSATAAAFAVLPDDAED